MINCPEQKSLDVILTDKLTSTPYSQINQATQANLLNFCPSSSSEDDNLLLTCQDTIGSLRFESMNIKLVTHTYERSNPDFKDAVLVINNDADEDSDSRLTVWRFWQNSETKELQFELVFTLVESVGSPELIDLFMFDEYAIKLSDQRKTLDAIFYKSFDDPNSIPELGQVTIFETQ